MRSCNYYYNNYNALATFLSCMHFSYELLDFIGMATRESRHAYFCFLQTHRFSKDLRVYCPSCRR